LVLAYYDAGFIDIQQHIVLVSRLHVPHHMLLDGSIDIGIAVISVID
jgi:hypothetical protein